MKEIIMGYQGEMSLKGLNRNQFEAAMMKILRYRLKLSLIHISEPTRH